MLINNLQKHRQLYSAEKFHFGASDRSYSASKPSTSTKTENVKSLKSKCRTQKKINQFPAYHIEAANTISHFQVYTNEHGNKNSYSMFKNIDNKNFKKHSLLHTQDLCIGKQQYGRKYQRISDPRHKVENIKKKQSLPENQKYRSSTNLRSKIETFKTTQNNNGFNGNEGKSKGHFYKASDATQKIALNPKDTYNLTTSTQTVKTNYKSIVVKPQKTKQLKAQEEQFIKNLKFHDVFFCADCYRYIFAIQKNYHYPACQNKIADEKLNEKQKYQIGVQKLTLLLQLSEYTKFKYNEIKNIYKQAIEEHKLPDFTIYPSARTYYTIIEIQTAANIIIDKYIAPYLCQGKNKYFCQNINCNTSSQL